MTVRILKIIAGIVTLTLPLWIVLAMCLTYAGLCGWLIFWVASYTPAVAILMVAPVAIAGLLFLAICVGGEILDSVRLRVWCDQHAEKYLPAVMTSSKVS
jgi:hypothetical protein